MSSTPQSSPGEDDHLADVAFQVHHVDDDTWRLVQGDETTLHESVGEALDTALERVEAALNRLEIPKAEIIRHAFRKHLASVRETQRLDGITHAVERALIEGELAQNGDTPTFWAS